MLKQNHSFKGISNELWICLNFRKKLPIFELCVWQNKLTKISLSHLNRHHVEPKNAAIDSRRWRAIVKFGRSCAIRPFNGKFTSFLHAKQCNLHINSFDNFIKKSRKEIFINEHRTQIDGNSDGLFFIRQVRIFLDQFKPSVSERLTALFSLLFAESTLLLWTRKLIKTIWCDIPRGMLLWAFNCSTGMHWFTINKIKSQRGKTTGMCHKFNFTVSVSLYHHFPPN